LQLLTYFFLPARGKAELNKFSLNFSYAGPTPQPSARGVNTLRDSVHELAPAPFVLDLQRQVPHLFSRQLDQAAYFFKHTLLLLANGTGWTNRVPRSISYYTHNKAKLIELHHSITDRDRLPRIPPTVEALTGTTFPCAVLLFRHCPILLPSSPVLILKLYAELPIT